MLDALNPPQRRAVEHGEGPLLILAGAGSGKTRVVTCRIAHLIAERDVAPEAILAVTFTNKAADEMQERVGELLGRVDRGDEAERTTISTFHSLGARLLRWHPEAVGLDRNFTILDQDDQLATVREVGERMGLELDRSERKECRRYIERMKNLGLSPREARERTSDREEEQRADFYETYQTYVREANVADFGDLILGPLEMFRDDRDLAESYSHYWSYLMVDEFQDTNPAQYELLEHLTEYHSNLAVVGDDDQAIYRWRDATVENILGFDEDYPDATVVKLEQNYRSTEAILGTANEIIANNPNRREKRLWTERRSGTPPTVFTGETGREEAEFVTDDIHEKVRTGGDWGEIAVFYRTNAQSRLFEENFRARGIPYRVVGGTSFYGRAEIKDVLAYLQLALNPSDDVSFLRVVGTPTRGVGDKTVEKLRRASDETELGSLFAAARYAAGRSEGAAAGLERLEVEPRGPAEAEALEVVEGIGGRPKGGLDDFCQLVGDLRDGLVEGRELDELTEHLLDRVNYFEWIEDRDPERAEEKRRNVMELVEAMRQFDGTGEEDERPVEGDVGGGDLVVESEGGERLQGFLEQSALVRDTEGDEEEVVTLMTVHGAKGLEFDTVYLTGMEDDLFPLSDDEPEELFEERRLAYVAITRARDELYITNARRRRRYGSTKRTRPSRFLLEVDREKLELDGRSCVDDIDYGRRRRGWQQRGGASEIDFDDGADRFFDQTAEREPDPFGEAVTEEMTAEDRNVSQVAPEVTEDEAEAAASRPGRTDDHNLVGETVTHNRFGIGEVLAVSEEGRRTRLTVQFPTEGEQSVYREFVKVVGGS